MRADRLSLTASVSVEDPAVDGEECRASRGGAIQIRNRMIVVGKGFRVARG